MTRYILLLGVLAFTLSACDTNDPDDIRVQAVVASDIAADPAERDPNTGAVSETGQYTLYSLRDGEVVLNYDESDRSDSLTTAWDIGFQGSTIIVNGGTSGPGTGGAVIIEEAYDDVAAVPSGTTFRVDGSAVCPSVNTPGGTFPGSPLAVCTGSGNGWYTYVPFATGGGYLVPTPGRTLLVRTADGEGFAKVRFESYYQGNPAPADITAQSAARYYTFEYVVNESGQQFAVEQD